MTAHDSGGATGVEPDGDRTQARFASSVYGGRPTFALARREGAGGASVALFELLPSEQAAVRKRRLERVDRRLVVEDVGDVFGEVVDEENTSSREAVARWDWSNWSAAKVARLTGSRLRSMGSLLREALSERGGSESGRSASAVTGTGDGDVFLSEARGVRLAIAFRGVKPIQRVDRMRALARGVARMSDEECYYWYAKCRSPSVDSGEQALRTLLTEHVG